MAIVRPPNLAGDPHHVCGVSGRGLEAEEKMEVCREDDGLYKKVQRRFFVGVATV